MKENKSSSTHSASDVLDDALVVSDGRLEAGLAVGPRALVLVLLLREDELGVRVLVDLLLGQVEGERADLLDRADRDLVLKAYTIQNRSKSKTKKVKVWLIGNNANPSFD